MILFAESCKLGAGVKNPLPVAIVGQLLMMEFLSHIGNSIRIRSQETNNKEATGSYSRMSLRYHNRPPCQAVNLDMKKRTSFL